MIHQHEQIERVGVEYRLVRQARCRLYVFNPGRTDLIDAPCRRLRGLPAFGDGLDRIRTAQALQIAGQQGRQIVRIILSQRKAHADLDAGVATQPDAVQRCIESALDHQPVIAGTLETLSDLAHTLGLKSPALIILGQVVALNDCNASAERRQSRRYRKSRKTSLTTPAIEQLCELEPGEQSVVRTAVVGNDDHRRILSRPCAH